MKEFAYTEVAGSEASTLLKVNFSEILWKKKVKFFPLFRNTYFKERIFKDCFHNLFLQSISSVL